METKFKSAIRAAGYSFGGAVCAGVVMLISSSAQAQNLFVAADQDDRPGTSIVVEITPDGAQSTFASGLGYAYGMAVNSAGNLFYADHSGNIYEYTPGGMRSTFASGVSGSLAFDSAGNLFAADYGSGNIYEYTPGGAQSIFASGVSGPLAFDRAGDLFVEDGGNIYEYTPGGVQSTFFSGLGYAVGGLAVNSAGYVFVTEQKPGGYIYEYSPGGAQSTFGSSLAGPDGLAIDSADNLYVADNPGLKVYKCSPEGVQNIYSPPGVWYPSVLAVQPVPEPSALGLLATGAIGFLVRRRRRRANAPPRQR